MGWPTEELLIHNIILNARKKVTRNRNTDHRVQFK